MGNQPSCEGAVATEAPFLDGALLYGGPSAALLGMEPEHAAEWESGQDHPHDGEARSGSPRHAGEPHLEARTAPQAAVLSPRLPAPAAP